MTFLSDIQRRQGLQKEIEQELVQMEQKIKDVDNLEDAARAKKHLKKLWLYFSAVVNLEASK